MKRTLVKGQRTFRRVCVRPARLLMTELSRSRRATFRSLSLSLLELVKLKSTLRFILRCLITIARDSEGKTVSMEKSLKFVKG